MWDAVESLAAGFTSPLRCLLSNTKAQSRSEIKKKREERKTAKEDKCAQKREPEPAVTVAVGSGGERLAEPSLQEEINVCVPK